jgi:hypothetical protein
VPRRLLAEQIAATFVVVLRFWLSSEGPITTGEVNALFRALTVPLLTAALE